MEPPQWDVRTSQACFISPTRNHPARETHDADGFPVHYSPQSMNQSYEGLDYSADVL